MASVLITRPRPASEPLAAALQATGYSTAIEPLLAIEPLPTPRPFGANDAVMITSSNALFAFEGRRGEIEDLFRLPCFCVGPRTGEKARAFGFHQVQNAAGDGAALARFMTGALKKNAAILHIAGCEAGSKAPQQLADAGYRVSDWPVYEAVPAAAFSPATLALFARQKLDAILVFSPRTAQVLANLLDAAALEACCGRLAAICLSAAVAEPLKSLGWRHLAFAPAPTEDAVLACLKKVCPVEP